MIDIRYYLSNTLNKYNLFCKSINKQCKHLNFEVFLKYLYLYVVIYIANFLQSDIDLIFIQTLIIKCVLVSALEHFENMSFLLSQIYFQLFFTVPSHNFKKGDATLHYAANKSCI